MVVVGSCHVDLLNLEEVGISWLPTRFKAADTYMSTSELRKYSPKWQSTSLRGGSLGQADIFRSSREVLGQRASLHIYGSWDKPTLLHKVDVLGLAYRYVWGSLSQLPRWSTFLSWLPCYLPGLVRLLTENHSTSDAEESKQESCRQTAESVLGITLITEF